MKPDSDQQQIAEFNDAWKGRGNLANLVTELERQRDARNDFVSDTRHLEVKCEAFADEPPRVQLIPTTASAFEWMPDGPMDFLQSAYHQLAGKTTPPIPTKFFDLMLADRPDRLTTLINSLHEDEPKKRFIRCLDNKIRAWLSNGYRVIENLDMAFTCLDEAQKKGAQVFEASLSDKRMRIKFCTQQVWDKIDITQRSGPKGEWFAGAIGNKELIGRTILGARIREELPGGPGTIHPVVSVLNSETGHGGFYVRIGILMGICFNVATLETVVSQVHLGERLDEGIFSREAISAESKAIMLKARDAVRAAFDQDKFRKMVAKAREAQADAISQPSGAIDNIVKAGIINEEQREAVLQYFLRDYDQTRFGLSQAVSRLAQDIDDSDIAGDMEEGAGLILKTPALAVVKAA